MKIQLSHSYNSIIDLENLFFAWREFIVGKRNKKDVEIFSRNLLDNILALNEDLANRTYCHGGYVDSYITDPKRRHIHKASVRDRLIHHAIYRILYPFFDRTFIADSFSCRNDKGMHKAMDRFQALAYKASKNHTRTCWVLKCDIRKFFDSIDHGVLMGILSCYIPDQDIMNLLGNVIESYDSKIYGKGIGLPLGNLTSQLFANVYMNDFDQWVKHKLKVKYYLRYADDFVVLSDDKNYLESILPQIGKLLSEELKLTLHPDKVSIKTLASGVDYLGWVHFTDHRVLRATTKSKSLNRIKANPTNATLQSYLGLLSHGNGNKICEKLLNDYWLYKTDDS